MISRSCTRARTDPPRGGAEAQLGPPPPRDVSEPATDVGATRDTVREVGARDVISALRLRSIADVAAGNISLKEGSGGEERPAKAVVCSPLAG